MAFKCYKNNFKYLYTYLVFVGIDAMVVVALGFEWLDLILLHKNVKIKLQQMQEILRQQTVRVYGEHVENVGKMRTEVVAVDWMWPNEMDDQNDHQQKKLLDLSNRDDDLKIDNWWTLAIFLIRYQSNFAILYSQSKRKLFPAFVIAQSFILHFILLTAVQNY